MNGLVDLLLKRKSGTDSVDGTEKPVTNLVNVFLASVAILGALAVSVDQRFSNCT